MIRDSLPPPADLELQTSPAHSRPERHKRWPLLAACALALGAFAFGALRTRALEQAEFEFTTPPASLNERMQQPNATRISARLGEVALAAGQFAVFELCGSDRFDAERWQGALELAVLQLEAKQLMLRVPLDAAHLAKVRRNSEAACLQLGSGPIEKSGTYSVEAVWSDKPPQPAIAGTPLVLRVLAKRPLSAADRGPVYALALATLAGLLLWLRATPPAAARREPIAGTPTLHPSACDRQPENTRALASRGLPPSAAGHAARSAQPTGGAPTLRPAAAFERQAHGVSAHANRGSPLSAADRQAPSSVESGAAASMPPRAASGRLASSNEPAAGAAQRPGPAAPERFSARALALRFGAAAGAVSLLYAFSQLPAPGSTWTLGKGALLFSLQVGLAWALARSFAPGGVAQALGVVAPLRPAIAAASALAAWPVLVAAARFALRLVPSTGEAPIQSFIAWPSGMLAVALLGVLLPAAEELFFRGYLYGALLPLGRLTAAILSVSLFGLLHAEQSWGNWGGLFAVFSAGAVLCAVRVVSGSTLLSALTHVAYNLSLSLSSIAASST